MSKNTKVDFLIDAAAEPQKVDESQFSLCVKKLTSDAILPVRGSSLAAGYDLSSSADCTVKPWSRMLIPTQLAIRVPLGTYGRIAPRSGLSVKHNIDIGAGVIDHDYNGHVQIVLINSGDNEFVIKKGDRIAQLIIEQIRTDLPVKEVMTLPETDRGNKGFGSTGLSSSSTSSST
jgi:dUTP pyrophosphatase